VNPLPVKLFRQGNSVAFIVKKEVAHLLGPSPQGWQAGDLLRIRVIEGGPFYERPLIGLAGGKNLAIVLTQDIMSELGLEVGETILVPFGDWVRLGSAGTSAGTGKRRVGDDDDGPGPRRGGPKRDKKSPRTHGHKGPHGGDEDHFRAYGFGPLGLSG
jgi:hypothetical protein